MPLTACDFDRLGSSRAPTGFWASEMVDAHRTFTVAGCQVQVATPGGAVPTPSAASLSEASLGCRADAKAMRDRLDEIASCWQHPVALEDVRAEDCVGVFIPGGRAVLSDLMTHRGLGAVLMDCVRTGHPVGAVGYGVAALLSAREADGRWAFRHLRLTGPSDEERRLAGSRDKFGFSVQAAMKDAGGRFLANRSPFEPHVVVDERLVTGANHASTTAAAKSLLALARRGALV
ncbi:type 1 glutamine amidotransferase domain-containing protein [Rothia sp. LK2588]|uniref:type 1 glutamine amidotransferase domain-containing protein n=1 Tax=Rothia sp. LK2588 TaxID=3114369 RepID=UPI0034CDD0AA